MVTPGYAPGPCRESPRPHAGCHGRRHEGGILGPGDRGCEQHGVAAEFHGQRRVGGGADPGVEDDGNLGLGDDQLDVVAVADSQPGADGRAQRHHRGAAGLLEPAGEHRIVIGVGQDGEPVGDQTFGRVEELERVR